MSQTPCWRERCGLLLPSFALLASFLDLLQIPCCAHACCCSTFILISFVGCPSTANPPFPIIVAQNCSKLHRKTQPRNRSINASTCKEVWLAGEAPRPLWLTLSIRDCSASFGIWLSWAASRWSCSLLLLVYVRVSSLTYTSRVKVDDEAKSLLKLPGKNVS